MCIEENFEISLNDFVKKLTSETSELNFLLYCSLDKEDSKYNRYFKHGRNICKVKIINCCSGV